MVQSALLLWEPLKDKEFQSIDKTLGISSLLFEFDFIHSFKPPQMASSRFEVSFKLSFLLILVFRGLETFWPLQKRKIYPKISTITLKFQLPLPLSFLLVWYFFSFLCYFVRRFVKFVRFLLIWNHRKKRIILKNLFWSKELTIEGV